jgi:hypothetical protein
VAAHLLDRVGGQVGTGAGGPGALPEQLEARRHAQLRQLVHRLRGQAQRGPAGGEHAQVLGHRHQRADQPGGAAEDVLAVVQDQQHVLIAQPAGQVPDRRPALLPDAEDGQHLGRQQVPVTHPVAR